MPNKPSAKKALRQSFKNTARNRSQKHRVKSLLKDARRTLLEKSGDASTMMPEIMKALDKATKTHAIHSNKASRLKSRLQRKINQARSGESKPIA